MTQRLSGCGHTHYNLKSLILNLCPVLNRLPQEIRAMTPSDIAILIRAWNEAQQGEKPLPPPDESEVATLIAKYPDIVQ